MGPVLLRVFCANLCADLFVKKMRADLCAGMRAHMDADIDAEMVADMHHRGLQFTEPEPSWTKCLSLSTLRCTNPPFTASWTEPLNGIDADSIGRTQHDMRKTFLMTQDLLSGLELQTVMRTRLHAHTCTCMYSPAHESASTHTCMHAGRHTQLYEHARTNAHTCERTQMFVMLQDLLSFRHRAADCLCS